MGDREPECPDLIDDEDDDVSIASNGDKQKEWEEWGEEDEQPAQCLYCTTIASSVEAALHHCSQVHSVNIIEQMKASGIADEYSAIKLVNAIRRKVSSNNCPRCDEHLTPNDSLLAHITSLGHHLPLTSSLTDDALLVPVLQNDPFLFALWDDEGAGAAAVEENPEALKERISQLEAALASARDLALGDTSFGEGREARGAARDQRSAEERRRENMIIDDTSYFASYSNFGIHYDMINDRIRTDAYRNFLTKNPGLISGKIVLDVGCGTGILSMFAARGGAARVIGVDMADIIDFAKEIVKENGLDKSVVLLKGKLEHVKMPVEKVDVIVSEWMGYMLLYESMLDTVIYARDHWLAPGGSVQPSHATMFVCGIDDHERVNFWDDVYGFDMKTIKREIYRNGIREPTVDFVNKSGVLTDHAVIKEIDTMTITAKDCDFQSKFNLTVMSPGNLHAIAGYFDVKFENCENPVLLTTSPLEGGTHWKQTIFFLQNPVAVQPGCRISGEIFLSRNVQFTRRLDIVLSVEVTDPSGALLAPPVVQHFDMN